MSDPKVAIITAASQGIGAGCARALAAADYKVVLLARSEKVHTVAEELGGVALQGDITDATALANLVALAQSEYGRVDAVVNNTGHPPSGELLDITDDAWHGAVDLILLSVIRMARLVVPMMQAQGGGAFVNITAMSAKEPNLGFPVSSTLRASLSAFTKLLADRYAADNIRMNSILPGYIDNWELDDATRDQIPLGRAGKIAEIGDTAAFLLSEKAGYITGQNITVDGGINRSL